MIKKSIKIAALLSLLLAIPPTASGNEEKNENIGWVTEVTGSAELTGAEGKSEKVVLGKEVFVGDRISTGDDSTVVIELEDESVISLGEKSSLKITSFIISEKENRSYFRLFAGKVRGLLGSLKSKIASMDFETDSAIAGVKGSDISVWIDEGETEISILEGEGYAEHKEKKFGKRIEIGAGYSMKFKKGVKPGKKNKLRKHHLKKLQKLKIVKNKKLIKKLKAEKLQKLKQLKKKKLNDVKPGEKIIKDKNLRKKINKKNQQKLRKNKR